MPGFTQARGRFLAGLELRRAQQGWCKGRRVSLRAPEEGMWELEQIPLT